MRTMNILEISDYLFNKRKMYGCEVDTKNGLQTVSRIVVKTDGKAKERSRKMRLLRKSVSDPLGFSKILLLTRYTKKERFKSEKGI